MNRKFIAGMIAIVMATAAASHSGVQNEAVKARMELMKTVAASVKAMAPAARGQVAYDSAAVQQAAAALNSAAQDIPAKFEANETDPASEAKPNVWSDWEGFLATAKILQDGAAAAVAADSPEAFQAAFGEVGGSCRACHSDYRL